MGVGWLLVVVVVVVAVAGGGDGFPAEDLVVRLPRQPEVRFRQYAGYVDVDVKNGRSLFYYFVEADDDPHHRPLTLWLNGGPGCSSVGGGAFTELGPFYPDGNGRSLRINSKSWNKASNLLFVESPAGVGWSYSNTTSDYTTGDANTARDMHVFLLNWFQKFPAFESRALYLTGESYAGHYIPQLVIALLDHNAHSTDFKFNIKGIAVRVFNFRVYFFQFCDFFTATHNESNACDDAIDKANTIIGDYVNNYDVILDVCYPAIVEQELRLKKMATKISLGVDVCMIYERHLYFNLPEVAGWATEYGNLLTFATVRGAAHMVAYSQPSRALHLFSSFVHGRRLPNNTRPSIYEIFH